MNLLKDYKNMLTSTLIVGKQVITLMTSGACLGIGFWMSKKITNVMDEYLLMYDKRKLEQLSKEMNLNY